MFESHPPHHLNPTESGFLSGFEPDYNPLGKGLETGFDEIRNCMTPVVVGFSHESVNLTQWSFYFTA